MKNRVFSGLILIISVAGLSQTYTNLVNNPSFEERWIPPQFYPLDWTFDSTTNCPSCRWYELTKAKHWFYPFGGPGIGVGYFNYDSICMATNKNKYGYNCYIQWYNKFVLGSGTIGTFPRSGSGSVILLNWLNATPGYDTVYNIRAYIKNKLKHPLKPNTRYCVTYHIKISKASTHATNSMGFYFSNDSLVRPYPYGQTHIDTVMFNYHSYLTPDTFYAHPYIVPPNPYDTLTWYPIQALWTAKGGEQFITIGNFKKTNQTDTLCTRYTDIDPLYYTKCDTQYIRNNVCGYCYGAVSYYNIDDVSVIEVQDARAAPQKEYTLCPEQAIQLGTDSTEDAEYYWYPSAFLSCTNCPHPIATPTTSITYYLTKKQCKITTTDFVRINVLSPPFTNFPSKISLCKKDTFQFLLNTTALSYSFYPSAFNHSDQNYWYAYPPNTQTFTISQNWYCAKNYSITDTITIDVTNNCDPFQNIPNIFTPNGDDINDEWFIQWKNESEIQNFHIEIFDRWGLKVFESDNKNFKWNGKNCAQQKIKLENDDCTTGTYYYLMQFTHSRKNKEYKGCITLLR